MFIFWKSWQIFKKTFCRNSKNCILINTVVRKFVSVISVKVCPHLYANANKVCGTVANPNEYQKVVCLAFASLNICAALRTYFSLKYRLQTDNVRLFTKCSPHKRMLFAALRLHVHINISLNSACFIQHSHTEVDMA